jgi:hypothetical protein
MSKIIWVVEDDPLFRDSLADEAKDMGVRLRFFQSMGELATADGSPHSIITDLGSLGVGFLPETHHYSSVLKGVRDKFPGAPIFIHSGFWERVQEIVDDMQDPMVHCITMRDLVNLMTKAAA